MRCDRLGFWTRAKHASDFIERQWEIIYASCGNLTVTWNRSVLDFLPKNRQAKTMQASPEELKSKIIESLNLQDVNPGQIADDAPLFGAGGLELDSIDALELVVMLEKNYGIVIKDMEEGRPAFQSVNALANFINARRQ
ncbi:MAG TPA: phosphopantetheine-binding protein [Verrucomicrobiae bacterium]|nr:phosphopantetheine-binding protein [Verrucomicrobiae bacterium]